MTLFSRGRFRGGLAVALAMLISFVGIRAARAGDTAAPAGAAPAGATNVPKAPNPGADTPPAVTPPVAPAPAPQLQLQDETPSNQDAARLVRSRATPVDDADERPFWKNWIFWTITGALVVGAIGMVAYTSSKTNSSLAPCPPDVVVSLGCFGAGR